MMETNIIKSYKIVSQTCGFISGKPEDTDKQFRELVKKLEETGNNHEQPCYVQIAQYNMSMINNQAQLSYILNTVAEYTAVIAGKTKKEVK